MKVGVRVSSFTWPCGLTDWHRMTRPGQVTSARHLHDPFDEDQARYRQAQDGDEGSEK
jgi:hypothetical protein